MRSPELCAGDIQAHIPGISDVAFIDRGGQKAVFACAIGGYRYALKLLCAEVDETEVAADATERAIREVATLRECQTPHLVQLGPYELTPVEIHGRAYLYFTEELVDGEDLRSVLRTGPLEAVAVARLGHEVSSAIGCLWEKRRIHRDVKPANIMRRRADGSFVLLDVGLVFDLDETSLTLTGYIPGTLPYLSPERTDLSRKREIDFRSDLFSLGIVMYEALTCVHPFRQGASSSDEVLANILTGVPPPPSQVRSSATDLLDPAIMQLLAKRPHLRFRTVERFQAALAETGLLQE
jgi:serine/threonine-protein kinase